MVQVQDVAEYVLNGQGELSTFKLQKLMYYCQGWHLALRNTALFSEPLEAWVNGPVAPALYQRHRRAWSVRTVGGQSSLVTDEAQAIVEQVLRVYGGLSPQELVTRTHAEDPWRDARKGLDPSVRGHNVITHEAMRAYFSSLLAA